MATGLYESIAIVANRQSSGGGGDSIAAGARRTAILNTEIYDADGIVTLSSNQFTLAAGDYEIEVWTVAAQTNHNKIWLYNATDATDALIGNSSFGIYGGNDGGSMPQGRGRVSIASAKAFEVQVEFDTTSVLGAAHSWGTEQYTTVIIRKIGSPSSMSFATVADQKAITTDGGDATSGAWRTRDLNTEIHDSDGIVSLSSNQFTLAAGTYEVIGFGLAYNVGVNQTRIYNATDSAEVEVGINAYDGPSSADTHSTIAPVFAVFTIGSAKAFELQHRVSVTQLSSAGWGLASDHQTEQYSLVHIRKIA